VNSRQRGLRTKVVQSGSAFSDYGDVTAQQFTSNGRGELTGAIGYLGCDITLPAKQLPGRRHAYAYDPAGRRQWPNRMGGSARRGDDTPHMLKLRLPRGRAELV
jgi:hypothetical protein